MILMKKIIDINVTLCLLVDRLSAYKKPGIRCLDPGAIRMKKKMMLMKKIDTYSGVHI